LKEILSKVDFVTKRRMICNKCEHMGIFFKVKVCKKCGCAVLGKTLMKGQQCPIGKWDAEKD
jgi:hypothetical protein